ncbi:MAG: S-methyl-5-thioribose-1-phosphate isomerase, partial [Treponema sp.]|nr:S-methyl-5-thioribose-1-phosphate isomerase [Treponema sp.]
TSGLAILAKHYDIPFYIFGPSTTIDMDCPTGADIEIELRKPGEITEMFYIKPMAPANIKCYNPAFDVTKSSLITAIVTEKGIHRPQGGSSFLF